MAGYLRREATLFKGMDRAIAAAAPGATPRVLDIGANHGLVAIFAALRGARVAAVEAQATLASLVKVSALANGVDVEVYHNAVLDVPAVVEIAELGAANDFNEGGTASLGAAREASQGGEVKMVQVRTASVDVVAREAFGADATIDFLKIDVEGVEPCINQIVAARHSIQSSWPRCCRDVGASDSPFDLHAGVEIPALRASLGLLGRGGVREASVEFGPAKRWAESEQHGVAGCVEIDQCVGCTRAVLARSSGEEPASPRHRAGVASMASRTTTRVVMAWAIW